MTRSLHHDARRREVALTALLLASGAAALLHESVWLRWLLPVLGAGALTAAAVSAGTLMGLALGAAVGGRLSDRASRAARVFVAAELLAAACGLAVPWGIRAVASADPGHSTLALAVLLCAVAAVPMGASLPAALRAVGPPSESVGAAFRRLYGWNTLGAVIGVLAAAGWLLEHLGNRGVVYVAAGLQVAVALLALRIGDDGREGPRVSVAPPRRPDLLGAAFLAGGAGLVAQVAWVRRLTPVVGNTTQAFATVLATTLLAIALGSLLLGPRRGRSSNRMPALVLVLAAVPVALLPGAIGQVDRWVASRLQVLDPTPWNVLWVRTLATGAILVPSTLLGAAALPWLVRATGAPAEAAGRASGRLVAANTAGAALFGLGGALFLLPAVGSAATLRCAAALYLVAAGILVSRRLRIVPWALALALIAQPWLRVVDDVALWDAVGTVFRPGEVDPKDARRLFQREGPNATVVVRDREGRRELWVDSKIVASAQPEDRLHLALLGYLPMVLHEDPRRVAVIGLGTGITSTAVAAWKPQRLDVFELEPAVADAASYFGPEGGGVPPAARVTFEDGRHAIARSDVHYDVITSDPIHPAVAGSASLYSVEHYRLLRARADLVCQWLPLYQMSLDDARLAVRSFSSVFEASYVFLAAADAILVGAKQPLLLDERRLRERLAGRAAEGLVPYGLRAPGRLLGLLARGPRGVAAFARAGPLNTDDRLLLEFRCGRSWFADEASHIARHLRIGRMDPRELLAAEPSAAFETELGESALFREATRTWLDWDDARALLAFDELARQIPGNDYAEASRDAMTVAVAEAELERGDLEGARTRMRSFLERPDLPPGRRLDAASVLIRAGAPEEGRRVARALLGDEGDWPRARRLAQEPLGKEPR